MYFFYNYDIRGSVTSILKPDGSLVKGYSYDEFGNTKETGEAQFKNDAKFTGAVHDTSADLYYMNSRFYNPNTGRFLSQDTYSGNPYDPWTQHLYSYTSNNPVNFIDPTGHMMLAATEDAAGTSVGDTSVVDEEKWNPTLKERLSYAAKRMKERIEFVKGFHTNYMVELGVNPKFAEAGADTLMAYQGGELVSGVIKTSIMYKGAKEVTGESISTIDRIRNVSQRGFDYAVENPRKSGLNRMQLGKDAEIQATRWIRKWAARNGIDMSEEGLRFQVQGEHSVPDVIYEPTKNLLDFKLTPKAIRKVQSDNFKLDFPGYNIEYIFGPGQWRS